jgi:ribose/xylose/arabinose/galactoside ABC-type transport system permease subunit
MGRLNQTQFGARSTPVGNDADAARKAGINVDWVIAPRLRHLGRLRGARRLRADLADRPPRPGFGEGREFDVIAAAVLGGTSLFGGIGSALSAVIGATLIQTVKAGLVFTGVNLYLQPIVLGFIIFAAVLIDSLRTRFRERIGQRMIRVEEAV